MMEATRDHGDESKRKTGSSDTGELEEASMRKDQSQGADSGGGGGAQQEDLPSPSVPLNGAESREAKANEQQATCSEQKAIEISAGAKIAEAGELEKSSHSDADLEGVNKPSPDDPQSEQHESKQSAGLSKNALKKLRKRAQLQEQKSLRKQREKRIRQEFHDMRRIEREELLQSMTEEERETYRAGKRARSLELRAKEKESIQTTRKMIAESKQRVCIDMEWHSQLTEKELNSLYKQLNYTYSAIRKAVAGGRKGLKLIFTGVDAALKQDMERKLNGSDSWPVVWSEATLLDQFKCEKDSLVYLTHESSRVLKQLSEDEVYIVGGIVDRNRIRGGTASKAKEVGLQTARLELSEESLRFTSGTTVLTVNHVVEILLEAANGAAWRDAVMKVLPARKGVIDTSKKK
ncbi:hypothetical protein NDN08_002016 [Rhodosorus marinus]|uniref:tRNA (guanine(9)-N(1))-methyltransferase n=1 Tax=Rhodosorus marinus TaxID=101924 RepID=A0AAV8USG9_9RHOD|nr:hypothetical protein NDN08_002016 [Rhodosorus marinus]